VRDSVGGGGGSVGLAAGGLIGSGVGAGLGKLSSDDPSAGAIWGAAAPVAGLGLRLLGNRKAGADLTQLRNLIAQRTPLYQERAAAAGMAPGSGSPNLAKGTRDAIATEVIKQNQEPTRVYIHKPDDPKDWEQP